MKPKQKEFREPKTTRKVMYQSPSGRFQIHEPSGGVYWFGDVRIIREKDYQRVLKAARRKVR